LSPGDPTRRRAAMLERGGQRQQAAATSPAAEVAATGRRRHYPEASTTSGETIPLCELRPSAAAAAGSDWSAPASRLQGGGGGGGGAADALKQLHAQSSAETSGVGDSLQRIHALSSTETSGYGGDAIQSPTDIASVTSPSDHPRLPATTAAPRCAVPDYQTIVAAAAPMSGTAARRSAGEDVQHQHYAYDGVASPPSTSHHQRHHRSSPTSSGRREAAGYRRAAAERFDDDEDEEFYLDDYDDRSTSSRDRYSRARARRSNGAGADNGVGSGDDERQFIRRNNGQSAWLRWSHERRASYRRKIEYMEKRQSDIERFRVSSPVRKARQESAR